MIAVSTQTTRRSLPTRQHQQVIRDIVAGDVDFSELVNSHESLLRHIWLVISAENGIVSGLDSSTRLLTELARKQRTPNATLIAFWCHMVAWSMLQCDGELDVWEAWAGANLPSSLWSEYYTFQAWTAQGAQHLAANPDKRRLPLLR